MKKNPASVSSWSRQDGRKGASKGHWPETKIGPHGSPNEKSTGIDRNNKNEPVGSGGASSVTAVGSSPAVGVVWRGSVGCVEGEATISVRGNAVGFEDTRVKGTSGGGDNELVRPVAVVTPAGGVVVVVAFAGS
jgi:hypothetical protein